MFDANFEVIDRKITFKLPLQFYGVNLSFFDTQLTAHISLWVLTYTRQRTYIGLMHFEILGKFGFHSAKTSNKTCLLNLNLMVIHCD